MSSPILTIDVAHPALPADRVESELEQAWTEVRNSATTRMIKIIHGYGSSGRGGSTREVVRNWAFRYRKRFKMVIPGEDCSIFDPGIQNLRENVGNFEDSDLGRSNPGITLIWVK